MNLIYLIILISATQTHKMESGHVSPIQAICQVELNSGKKIEGAISLYNIKNRNYFERGFLLNYDFFKIKYPFSLDFKKISLYNLKESTYLKFDERNDSTKSSYIIENLYFIDLDIENKKNESSQDFILDTIKNTLIIKKKSVKNYDIEDSIEIYLELPLGQDISNKNEELVKTISISIRDIKKFEFLDNPSKKWLDEIEKKKSFIDDIGWYHKIVSNEETLKNYKKRIKQRTKFKF